MRDSSRHLGIPEEHIDNELVRTFLDASTDLSAMMYQLGIAESGARGWAAAIESGNLEPSLVDRYRRAGALVVAALELLHDGMPRKGLARPNFVKHKLNDAVACYGLEVIDADPNSPRQRTIRLSDRYRGRPLDPPDVTG